MSPKARNAEQTSNRYKEHPGTEILIKFFLRFLIFDFFFFGIRLGIFSIVFLASCNRNKQIKMYPMLY